MRTVKLVVALLASIGFVVAAETSAGADSTHICQGSRNCNDVDGGGGNGHGNGGGGKGGGRNNNTVECSNEGGDTLVLVQANVCPTDFPILVNVL